MHTRYLKFAERIAEMHLYGSEMTPDDPEDAEITMNNLILEARAMLGPSTSVADHDQPKL